MLESRGKEGEGLKSTRGGNKVLYSISLHCSWLSTVNSMINISCSERCFNGLLDYKQTGKWVFKLSHRGRFIGGSVIWRLWDNLLLHFKLNQVYHRISSYHEGDENEILGARKKREKPQWYRTKSIQSCHNLKPTEQTERRWLSHLKQRISAEL